jgi:murein tripeptide amidase MpaA
MPYLSVDAVESAIATLAATYPNHCQLIKLPNRTIEGRICHALDIGSGKSSGNSGGGDADNYTLLLTGAVHAREWGGSEICVYFAADILEAYTRKTGLRYGGKYFDADQVRSVVKDLKLIVFPLVNPDGRQYSQTIDPLWRRNRNPAESRGNPDCIGVDLNRNYDFLWDHTNLFSHKAYVHTSSDPCDPNQTYRGSAPFSEPETKNIKWLLDSYPQIRWYIDLHSHGEQILHCWGDDENQSNDATMNFANSSYNSLRGEDEDEDYKEYIPSSDLAIAVSLAKSIRDGIKAVREVEYVVKPSYNLYPTSGVGDDYAYCRHFSDPNNGKILAYTIEWGKEFHPPWNEMEKIVIDISAGLLEFCLATTTTTTTTTTTAETKKTRTTREAAES